MFLNARGAHAVPRRAPEQAVSVGPHVPCAFGKMALCRELGACYALLCARFMCVILDTTHAAHVW